MKGSFYYHRNLLILPHLMLNVFTILKVFKSRAFVLAILFITLTTFSFAGTGDGGGSKSKTILALSGGFSPAKITSGFTLKTKAGYRGNTILSNSNDRKINYIQLNSLVTFQKGNVTYILPHSQKISISSAKSNLQVVNLKVNIHR